ncbi:MAG: hypothetical protein ABSD62_07325 [Candidatus Limnocylindrales bacterium]|jgi:hypothetical protein
MPDRTVIDNPDVLPYALYLLGGTGDFVDVEEIFLKCYELAPERFGWRTQKLPNYKTLYKALRDFEAKHPRAMIKTSNGLGRQLTAEGIEYVRARLDRLEPLRGPSARPPAIRVRAQRLLQDLVATPAAQRFFHGDTREPTRYEAAEALLCAPDSSAEAWHERLAIYRSSAEAARRGDVLSFLEFLDQVGAKWYGGASK